MDEPKCIYVVPPFHRPMAVTVHVIPVLEETEKTYRCPQNGAYKTVFRKGEEGVFTDRQAALDYAERVRLLGIARAEAELAFASNPVGTADAALTWYLLPPERKKARLTDETL